jgi:hypothetical protein
MKKILITCGLALFLFQGHSQSTRKATPKGQFSIYYSRYERGTIDEESNPIILTIEGLRSRIIESFGEKKMISQVPKEEGFVLIDSAKCYQTASLKSGEKIMYITPFDKLPKLEFTGKLDTILGYPCEIFKTVVRSNQVEISVSQAFGSANASPIPSLGIPNGVVLKIVINGNSEVKATKIVENIASKKISLPSDFRLVSASLYRSIIANGYITNVSIFENEQICFGCIDNTTINDNKISQTFKFANGTVILKKVFLPKISNGQVFAELTEFSNGDAYDRTGSIFIIPTNSKITFLQGCFDSLKSLPIYNDNLGKTYQGVIATDNYSPIIELIRFYTPFGVKQYNNQVIVEGLQWADSAYYKQEITSLLPILTDEVWIGAFIGNYDKGGHKINLRLKYYPDSKEIIEQKEKKRWICPLFCTNNVLEMAGQEYGTMFSNDSLTVKFTIPQGVTNLKLRYISTGHGGWDGGDEFTPKKNEIFIDEKKVFEATPWRTDCGTYRLSNPASGNFWNGTSSSDYSRSGWCPGTATNPIEISLENLTPGVHELKLAIPQGKSEGGSFSSWNVSGVLIGDQN